MKGFRLEGRNGGKDEGSGPGGSGSGLPSCRDAV